MCIEIRAFSGKKRNIESVIIKSLQKKSYLFCKWNAFFSCLDSILGSRCRIGLSIETIETKILEDSVIFFFHVKLESRIREKEVVEKFKLCQQVEPSLFRHCVCGDVTFPFLLAVVVLSKM